MKPFSGILTAKPSAALVKASKVEHVSTSRGARTRVTLPDGYSELFMGRLGKGEAVANAVSMRGKRQTILTDVRGVPLDKPRRADFDSDLAFIHATHAFNDKVTGIGNKAFDKGFKAAMARPSMPPGTRRG